MPIIHEELRIRLVDNYIRLLNGDHLLRPETGIWGEYPVEEISQPDEGDQIRVIVYDLRRFIKRDYVLSSLRNQLSRIFEFF